MPTTSPRDMWAPQSLIGLGDFSKSKGKKMDTELVNRTALDAANAIAWPGDDDATVSIADEDDLRKVLEAAAPHIVHPLLKRFEAVLLLNSPDQAVAKCRAIITETLEGQS